jgi:hypothetical protein
VLRKKLVDSLPTGNPDVASPPRLLSSTELPLAQQRSDRLKTRSEGIGCLGHCEVVVPHLEKLLLQLSQTPPKQLNVYRDRARWRSLRAVRVVLRPADRSAVDAMETYLRLMFLKFRYVLDSESLCREVSDSIRGDATWCCDPVTQCRVYR